MDKALLLSPFEARGALALAELPCGTLLVGSEFCQNQAPGAPLLRKLAKKFPGARLWLATSLLTDRGLARWEALLAALPRGLVEGVVVNDWGLLPALKRYGPFELSAGRLLLREFLRIDKVWAKEFLAGQKAGWAEADTPELEAAARALKLKVSRHAPLAFTAVTTFCPFEKHFKAACGHACEGRLDELRNRRLKTPLYLAEKAYFSPAAPLPARPAPARAVVTLNFEPGRREAC